MFVNLHSSVQSVLQPRLNINTNSHPPSDPIYLRTDLSNRSSLDSARIIIILPNRLSMPCFIRRPLLDESKPPSTQRTILPPQKPTLQTPQIKHTATRQLPRELVSSFLLTDDAGALLAREESYLHSSEEDVRDGVGIVDECAVGEGCVQRFFLLLVLAEFCGPFEEVD